MRRSTILVAGLLLVACVSGAAFAQEPGKAMTPEEQAMMAKWMEFATPGEPHQLLAKRVGAWTVKVTSWTAPDAPPTVSEGTAEVKSVLDGRYIEEITVGSFQGMPFHGRGITGYDNLKKKYVGTWIDNMGTGISFSEGEYDAAKKTFNYAGTWPDAMSGEYKPMKGVETWTGPDTYKAEAFCQTPDGKDWWKMMELNYTRKK